MVFSFIVYNCDACSTDILFCLVFIIPQTIELDLLLYIHVWVSLATERTCIYHNLTVCFNIQ